MPEVAIAFPGVAPVLASSHLAVIGPAQDVSSHATPTIATVKLNRLFNRDFHLQEQRARSMPGNEEYAVFVSSGDVTARRYAS